MKVGALKGTNKVLGAGKLDNYFEEKKYCKGKEAAARLSACKGERTTHSRLVDRAIRIYLFVSFFKRVEGEKAARNIYYHFLYLFYIAGIFMSCVLH